ncbi:MAG: histidine kinase, partial [Bacteroidota bacterium]
AHLKKKSHPNLALLSIIPLGICLAFFYPLFYDQIYFLSLSFFIAMQVILMNQFLRNLRREYESSLQRVHMLRAELLKKNLKPHFLLNTLTSLISWVEESPKVAIRFIEALATEFDLLSSAAEKDLIPLEEEITLCKEHLKLMSFRNEISYSLKIKGETEGLHIPPAIILTLIENGLSHNFIEEGYAEFQLSIQKAPTCISYRLISPGQALKEKEENKAGTGWKYIHARLELNYPAAWKMESYAGEREWINIIHIYTGKT